MKSIDQMTPKLVHQVVLKNWSQVVRVLRLFNRKQHQGFLLDIDEFSPGSWRVMVYKQPTW